MFLNAYIKYARYVSIFISTVKKDETNKSVSQITVKLHEKKKKDLWMKFTNNNSFEKKGSTCHFLG